MEFKCLLFLFFYYYYYYCLYYYLAFYSVLFAVSLKLLVHSMVLQKPDALDAPEILYYKCWLGLGVC